jgi:hypothetical protein
MPITNVELRDVKLLFDCDGKMYRDIAVSIFRKADLISIVNELCTFLGDVEYNDGSFLSVYDYAGSYVALEYDADCNLIVESEVVA